MNKTTKFLIFLIVVILVFLLILTIKVYSKAVSEDNIKYTMPEDILNISATNKKDDNVLETIDDDMPIVIPNSLEDEGIIEDNSANTSNTDSTENTNNSYESVEYKASNGKKYEVIANLNIPSLGIEYPVLSTTSTESLKIALNKYWGPNPNEVGNMVIVGHNYKNTKFFSKLPNIKIGSIIKITDTTGRTLEYKVYKTDVIDPYDNSCTSQLTNGQTEITLITCYNNGKQRFIAKARAN